MSIVGGVDIHREQLTFDYLDGETGQVERGWVVPADREHLAEWLRRFDGVGEVAFAIEGCTGWRYMAEEMRIAGVTSHLAEPADTSVLRGPKRRAKTDRADAQLLRRLLVEGRLPECYIPPPQVASPAIAVSRPAGTAAGRSGSMAPASTRAWPRTG